MLLIGAVVVYDCTDSESFKKMHAWVTELKNFLPNDIPIMIAGNKCDLEKSAAIDPEMALKYAKSINCDFFRTSAKTT